MDNKRLLQALIRQMDLIVNEETSPEYAAAEISKEYGITLSSFGVDTTESLDLMKLYLKITQRIAAPRQKSL